MESTPSQRFADQERIMTKNANRTFSIAESGKTIKDISLAPGDTVEVLDLTTRATLHMRASQVSMYRHTLRLGGKNFNIVNIREAF
jgi:hypothetical protein